MVAGILQLTPMSKGNVMQASDYANDTAFTQSGINILKVEDFAHKEEASQREGSPERTPALLPPFGPSSHLPTPQSPGNLTNYLSGPPRSPLSLGNTRSLPVCHFSSTHPPSRPTSVNPPQTPQRSGSSALASIHPLPSTPMQLKDRSRVTEGIEPVQPHLSQIATPSPEVFRSRRASVPSTPTPSEATFTTPRVGRRSSSHPYTMPSPLAPAPIISPVNLIHSTVYHPSPEAAHESSKQPDRKCNFSHAMTALVSEHNVQTAARDQGYYDLDDPFVVHDKQDRDETLARKRYLSPSTKRSQHNSPHGSYISLVNEKVGSKSTLENSIAPLVMSPSEFSVAPSRSFPVKAEVEDGENSVDLESPLLLPISRVRTPASPRTPPPIPSGRASVAGSHVSTLEDSIFRTPPPPSGGEIERIRKRQAVLEEARITESEKRRPEYLTRAKRARDQADEQVAELEQENDIASLGVTVSPFRGRRLKLYQPVPVASTPILEHDGSDLAEGKTPPPLGMVSTPWKPSIPTMSLRSIDWHAPRRDHSSSVLLTEENELKKQKRLEAFAATKASGRGRGLQPVELAGQGRVLIDMNSDQARELVAAGTLQIPETLETDSVYDAESLVRNGHGAEWPDQEYPWSEQERQRDEYGEAARQRRLAWIARFLDRESESEDDETECVAGPSTPNQTIDVGPPPTSERGRGKNVSLNAVPNSKPSGSGRRMLFGAANADARQVLLSKKHVRAVAERMRKRKLAEEEEGVVMCICQGADDGRPMVRCDDCRTWYHLICMDIHDEAELGDLWYCWKCLPSAEDPPPPPSFEPTFAPAVPDSPPRAGVGDQPLYQYALQPSPMPASPIAQREPEHSPRRRSRPSHSLGDPDDPVRGGPSTPYHPRVMDSRLYSTPKFFDEYSADEHVLFDPTSTPTRGLKVPNHLIPITPRRSHAWTPAQPVSWTTPSGLPRTPQHSSLGSSSLGRSGAHSLSTLDDSGGPLTSPWRAESPTRRSHRGGDSSWPYPMSRHLLDSPLAMRSSAHRSFLPSLADSATPRHFPKGKASDIGELTFGVTHPNHHVKIDTREI